MLLDDGRPGCPSGAPERAWHGTNVFLRVGGRIYRTYFVDARGDEQLGSVFSYLDVTALGRMEDWEDSPEGYPQHRRRRRMSAALSTPSIWIYDTTHFFEGGWPC